MDSLTKRIEQAYSKPAYGQKFTLLKTLERVESWNSSSGSWANLNKGETITVERVYDSTSTTIECQQEDGLPLTAVDGTPDTNRGYRFIVNNVLLGEAIGVKMPAKTEDFIGDLIAYETGTADVKTTKRLFKKIKKTGLDKQLQGHYGRQLAN